MGATNGVRSLIGDSIRGNLFVSSVLALGFGLVLFLHHSRHAGNVGGAEHR